MAESTGIVLTAGAITLANEAIFAPVANHGKISEHFNWRIIPATLLGALALSGLEKIAPKFATGLAWLSLATVFIVPLGNAATPLDNALKVLGYKP